MVSSGSALVPAFVIAVVFKFQSWLWPSDCESHLQDFISSPWLSGSESTTRELQKRGCDSTRWLWLSEEGMCVCVCEGRGRVTGRERVGRCKGLRKAARECEGQGRQENHDTESASRDAIPGCE
eukprot:121702-Rhodomonas_salina.1